MVLSHVPRDIKKVDIELLRYRGIMAMPVVKTLKHFSTGWEVHIVPSSAPSPSIPAARPSPAIPSPARDSAPELFTPSSLGVGEAPVGPGFSLLSILMECCL